MEEDAASKEASPSGELTEQQLRMVEQIADRYLAAQPKAKKPRRWPFVLAGAVLLFGLVNLLAQLDALRMQQESIQSNLSRVENSVDRQIGSITGKVEELLKAQNDLTADYGTEVASTNLFSNSITFSLYAVPKNYTEGMRAEFYADDGSGRKVPAAGVYQPELGERFFADLKCGLTDSITLSVVFTASDGTRQTQLLDTYEGLYSATMPDGTVDDNLMWKELEAPGVLTLTEDERYVWVRQYDPSAFGTAPAAVQSIRVGLFLNQTLQAWAEPCEVPESYHGFDESSFFYLPDIRLPLTVKDQLQVAAVVTDEYGRRIIWAGIPYILNSEDMELTHPDDCTLDSDPAHWTFS